MISEENKRLAEFHHENSNWTYANGRLALSIEIGPNIHGGIDGYLEYDFDYDKDWNKMMKVLQKIEKIFDSGEHSKIFESLEYFDIEKTHKLAFEFVERYNKDLEEDAKLELKD